MVPAHVLKRLKNDITTTDRYKDVTIIFADICGFTNWSSNKKPIEVVGMLSKLFTKFDNLCEQNKVYKVHTIGDCYVVLGLLVEDDDSSRDPVTECLNMVQMALSMINCINDVNREENLELNMRIGIHTGDVVAGITGTKIVRYDIYGPDVDFANKMESGGQAGKINVSEITKAILEKECPNRFSFEYNKDITHKPVNKTLKSYFLEDL
jgi:class 3 adenylate cyclase